MMWRFRDKLLDLRSALSFRRRRRPRRSAAAPVLRGNMRRVLVLNPPGQMFAEAVFILRDDYFQTPGMSRQELLKQAKNAAEDYIDTVSPSGGSTPLFPSAMSVFVLGAACAILALWLTGLIG